MAAIQGLDRKQRLKKAVRHIHDALNLRTVRNDLESRVGHTYV